MLQREPTEYPNDLDHHPATLRLAPLPAAWRDGPAGRVFKITDDAGAAWRVLDVVDDGLRRAVAPGVHRRASHRYFVRDDTCELRSYTFATVGTRVLSMPILHQQLTSAIPGEWC